MPSHRSTSNSNQQAHRRVDKLDHKVSVNSKEISNLGLLLDELKRKVAELKGEDGIAC